MHESEPVGHPNWRVGLAIGLPVLVAVILMAPRILDAHFGLFDDPASVTVAEQTWAGTWDWRADNGQYGRFRPIYWLSFSLGYGLAGKHPAWYFLANLVLLVGTASLLSAIVLRLTHRPLAAGVTGLAFVLGGPVIEATYTLSKPELLQCFFLAGSGAVLALPPWGSSRGARACRVMLAAICILLASLTKETSGLALAIAVGWLLVAWLGGRTGWKRNPHQLPPLLVDYLLAAGLGVGAYVAGALALSPTTISGAGPRANFAFTSATLEANAHVWLDLIVRDWLQLLPLVVAAAYRAVSTRKLAHSLMMLGSLFWMGAWFALYLPYRFTPEYYLLPFSLGAAVLTGLLALQVVDAPRAASPAATFLVKGCGALAAVLMLLTIPNNLTNAGIQLSVDRANAAMLEFVAENAPADGLVLVNIRADTEYLWRLAPMLHSVYDRPDLTVEPYPGPVLARTVGNPPTLVLSPFIENVPLPSVRLGIPEEASREWEADLQQELGGRLSLQRETRFGLHLLAIDAPRLICLAVPQIGYCQRPHTPFDTRRFAVGWRVYALSAPTG